MKDLVEFVAKSLVDDPDAVDVTVIDNDNATVIELRVAEDDVGKFIGKQGRTAKAMRTILSAASAKVKRRAVLEIVE